MSKQTGRQNQRNSSRTGSGTGRGSTSRSSGTRSTRAGSTSARSTRTGSTGTRSTARRSTSARSGNRAGSGRTSGNTGWQGVHASNRAKQLRAKKKRIRRIRRVIAVLVPVALIVVGIFVFNKATAKLQGDHIKLMISGIDASGMSREKVINTLEERYPWSLSVRFEDQSYPVENFMDKEIRMVVEQAFSEKEAMQKELAAKPLWERLHQEDVMLQYALSVEDIREDIRWVAHSMAEQWSVEAMDAEISSFDQSRGAFLFTEPTPGMEVDSEDLDARLWAAVEVFDFDEEIGVTAQPTQPKISAGDYTLMGSYTTDVTENVPRNTNIRLASEAVDGYVLQPGEQFSFNQTVGRRTPEKGYQLAGAYVNGESVQEYGGGVCQVSSTLYNAVVAAGLRPDARVGHSYEPTYVTPGQDATVSFDQPDFAFTNTSSHSVGIRSTYANNVMRVDIFGIPVLEPGTKRYMFSEQTGEIAPPEATYEEDPTVEFGQEVVSKQEKPGSVWTTYIVLERNGEILEKEYLHTTKYKGKGAVIRRNTTTPTQQPQEQQAVAEEAPTEG